MILKRLDGQTLPVRSTNVYAQYLIVKNITDNVTGMRLQILVFCRFLMATYIIHVVAIFRYDSS